MTLPRWTRIALASLLIVVLGLATVLAVGASASSRRSRGLVSPRRATLAELEASLDTPGPIVLESVVGADWSIDRSGLIDLDDPRAASLEDGAEPIAVGFHALFHSREGLVLIDSGVEQAMVDRPSEAAVRGVLADVAHIERMVFRITTAAWLAQHAATPVRSVFLTHAHLDHVLGLGDVPVDVPVVLGEGELEHRAAMNLFTQSTVDRALGAHPLETWSFGDELHAVLDVFGDGSLWAIAVRGHSPGSVAFVVRTTEGAVLLTGDVSHTAWGWDHDVPPGTFSDDAAASRESFSFLRALASRHPSMGVRFGHQALTGR